ncbi:hypothetical protein QL285_080187 [Trifolium repens]|nr:hypothetical protein QL285_080187 [Trifolium repens]
MSAKEEPCLRHNIFHPRCTTVEEVCDVIIDSGSCENLVSNYMVDKLELPTQNRPHLYKLQCIKKGSEVKVTKHYLVSFSIGQKYQDKVWCDVIPMDACHLLLGRHWQYDRRATYDGYANIYYFIKDGVKVKSTVLPPNEINKSKKESSPLVTFITKEQLKETIEEVKTINIVNPSPYLDDELDINSRASSAQPGENDTIALHYLPYDNVASSLTSYKPP